jgi:hypothetical protein
MFVFDDRWHGLPEVPFLIIVNFVEDFWKIEEERKRIEEERKSYQGGFGDKGNSSSSDDDWGGFGDKGF